MNFALSSRPFKTLICVSLAAIVCGCSLMAKKQVEYKGADTLPPLKVPPGLTHPPPSHETLIPAESGAKMPGSAAANLAAPPIVALETNDIQLQSDGALHWLVIQESDEDAWLQIRDFWERNGIALADEDAKLGIMETAWLSQEAPAAAGSSSDGNAASPGTAVQKKFRVRLDHYSDTGSTDVFISCRLRRQSGDDGHQWVPLPADPALEADMMNRLLVFLGGGAAGTQKVTIQAPPQGFVKRVEAGAQPSLVLDKPLGMAWRHVGQALDRFGYTIVAQDRPSHKYLITLGGHPPQAAKKAGWLSWLLFSTKDDRPGVPVYRVNLTPGKGADTVVTTDVDPDTGADPGRARKILDEIYGELR